VTSTLVAQEGMSCVSRVLASGGQQTVLWNGCGNSVCFSDDCKNLEVVGCVLQLNTRDGRISDGVAHCMNVSFSTLAQLSNSGQLRAWTFLQDSRGESEGRARVVTADLLEWARAQYLCVPKREKSLQGEVGAHDKEAVMEESTDGYDGGAVHGISTESLVTTAPATFEVEDS